MSGRFSEFKKNYIDGNKAKIAALVICICAFIICMVLLIVYFVKYGKNINVLEKINADTLNKAAANIDSATTAYVDFHKTLETSAEDNAFCKLFSAVNKKECANVH